MKYLIVNADDFGRTTQINQAVIHTHQHGILTSASLMVNEQATQEAVNLAKANPRLAVGLHLVLVCGRSTLPHSQIPDLVNREGNFSNQPIWVGLRYHIQNHLYSQLKAEIIAQVEKFLATGLYLDHINGHLNIHLHPTVFKILCDVLKQYKIPGVRISQEPLLTTLRIDTTNLFYKISHSFIFQALSRKARYKILNSQVIVANQVYGLLQTGRMHLDYVSRILLNLSDGIYEIYFHPSVVGCPIMQAITPDYLYEQEVATLVSPKIRKIIDDLGFHLTNYQSLFHRRFIS